MDAIQSEDSHVVVIFVNMMAGTNRLLLHGCLLKGELWINEERKRPVRETENEDENEDKQTNKELLSPI